MHCKGVQAPQSWDTSSHSTAFPRLQTQTATSQAAIGTLEYKTLQKKRSLEYPTLLPFWGSERYTLQLSSPTKCTWPFCSSPTKKKKINQRSCWSVTKSLVEGKNEQKSVIHCRLVYFLSQKEILGKKNFGTCRVLAIVMGWSNCCPIQPKTPWLKLFALIQS